ncbi:hypothetical protein PEDI_14170 [Persicobacter diffluens]|uniref:Uncharacterized protein n=1 Tax=Persicobacter diffluens TaxID=981 RepID=A0AAN5AIU2_9BACT|nr:hypothetical protein PEDI_14170 [Persicobacter diffluens]
MHYISNTASADMEKSNPILKLFQKNNIMKSGHNF